MKFWRLAIFVDIQSLIFKYDFIKVWPSLCWTCRVWEGQGKKCWQVLRDEIPKYPFFLIKWAKHLPWNLSLLELQAINIDLIFLRNYVFHEKDWMIIYFLSKHLDHPCIYQSRGTNLGFLVNKYLLHFMITWIQNYLVNWCGYFLTK